MASFINKRQQARNERTLQDLIRSVPGNERCADCMARNPGWASWSLGIFLCMRCASLHRKLGTHISKVKSLSMDSWSTDQVENMKLTGNFSSNQVYNPLNIKPSIPLDADEVDSTMERFIRQKYQQRNLGLENPRPVNTHTTGSTSSNDDPPPPLPPKPTSRFGSGLRSASSTFPMSLSRMKSHPSLPSQEVRPPKFVSPAGDDPNSNLEYKASALKDMGFPDEQRNIAVLKGLNGNVEKAVEALVRLGEGGRSTRDAARDQAIEARVISTSTNQTPNIAETSIAQQKNQNSISQAPPNTSSTIPDQVSSLPPAGHPNSFDPVTQPQPLPQQLEQHFQTLHVSQQPLFPNNTGGWIGHEPHQHFQTNPFLKTFTPPISPSPYQYNPTTTQESMFTNSPNAMQSLNGNPFFVTSQNTGLTPSNPFVAQLAQNVPYTSPYQSEQAPPVPTLPSWVPQQHLSAHVNPAANPALSSQNPFFQQMQAQSQSQSQWQIPHPIRSNTTEPTSIPLQFQQHYQQQPIMPQQTGRYDKNSILALYDYPQLAPPRPSSNIRDDSTHQSRYPNPDAPKERSVTMPILPTSASSATHASAPMTIATGSNNPFATAGNGPGTLSTGKVSMNESLRNVSRDSVDFAGLSGRHSPDAFAGLSARYG